jgi:hypothetical protein
MSEEEEFVRKPRPWIIAIIAVVTVIAASLLAFRAFNTRANAEAEAHPQSAQSEAHQSIGSQSDDAQSGETPFPTPTPAEITKPTPPNGLHEGGLVGAQVTAVWFVDLWEYAFNTGDTGDFMALCQDGDFCDDFSEDMRSYHENRIVTVPLEINIQPDGNSAFGCYLRTSGISGLCVHLSLSQKSARFSSIGPTNDTREYTTLHTVEASETQEEYYSSIIIFLTEEDDGSFVVRNIDWIDPEHT